MGYGAGHDIKVRITDIQVQYNSGRLYFRNYNIISWDMTHPMDGMTEIHPRLINIQIPSIELNQEDKDWLKKQGVENNDYIDDCKIDFTGQIWSGYCRSSVENSFPVELKGEFDNWYLGSVNVTAKMTCNDVQEFEDFIEDVLDFCADDTAEDEDGNPISFEEQYEIQEEINRMNYGVEE